MKAAAVHRTTAARPTFQVPKACTCSPDPRPPRSARRNTPAVREHAANAVPAPTTRIAIAADFSLVICLPLVIRGEGVAERSQCADQAACLAEALAQPAHENVDHLFVRAIRRRSPDAFKNLFAVEDHARA